MVKHQRHLGETGPPAGLSTIAEVVAAAGEDILQAVELPDEGRPAVSGSVLYDAAAEPIPFPGAIAMAVGLAPDREDLGARLAELGKAGYSGLIYKANGAPDAELRRAARTEGIALLRAPDALHWSHLLEIVAAAITPYGGMGRNLADTPPGDLFDLANTIAVQTNGAVAIVDEERAVLAYSTLPDQAIDETRRASILHLQVPDSEQNDADYRRVHASQGVISIATEAPSLRRRAVAIRAGGTLLGSLWILQPEGQAEPPDKLLVEAANLAALHILHRRTTYVSALTRQAGLLRSLLFEPRQARLAGDRLGLSAEHVAVVAVSPWPLQEVAIDTLQSGLRLFDLIRTSCAVQLPSAVCGTGDNIVYIVVPRDNPGAEAFQRAALLKIVQNAGRLASRSLLAGVGKTEPIGNLAASRIDAEEVLGELLRQAGESRLIREPEGILADRVALGSTPYLRQIVSELTAAGRLPGKFATRIADFDADHGTAFAATLRTYLDSGGNALCTARSLGVHANTVRYRLSRIEPLFGLDLSDPETRLLLWLQLWNKYESTP